MRTFVNGAVVMEIDVDGARWTVRVVDVFDPSAEEIAANEAFNDTLGDWSPNEKPTERSATLQIATATESFEINWSPSGKRLQPHVSRRGWARATFNQLKRELLRWKFPSQQ